MTQTVTVCATVCGDNSSRTALIAKQPRARRFVTSFEQAASLLLAALLPHLQLHVLYLVTHIPPSRARGDRGCTDTERLPGAAPCGCEVGSGWKSWHRR